MSDLARFIKIIGQYEDLSPADRFYLNKAADRLTALEEVLKAAEAFLSSLPQHYHGFPGKLVWPEVHVLKQRVEGMRSDQ